MHIDLGPSNRWHWRARCSGFDPRPSKFKCSESRSTVSKQSLCHAVYQLTIVSLIYLRRRRCPNSFVLSSELLLRLPNSDATSIISPEKTVPFKGVVASNSMGSFFRPNTIFAFTWIFKPYLTKTPGSPFFGVSDCLFSSWKRNLYGTCHPVMLASQL